MGDKITGDAEEEILDLADEVHDLEVVYEEPEENVPLS